MKLIAPSVLTSLVCLVLVSAPASPAFGQGGATSSISGTVTDASGAIIPGADIVAKNTATNAESRAVSSESGTFSIPALNAGTYTVTVSLMGFKTAVLNNVVINAGVPGAVKAVMEVGGLEETVVVQAASEILQTQNSQVSSTLNATMLTNLPLISRAALNSVVGLGGVNTPGGTRESTINGLPQSTINITLDGMNIQDNWLKTTDGFFARLNPSLDAVEEVTVTTAANGADSAGQGAANIRMTTRSGTNNFRGSGYYYLRHDALNANTWFNNRDLAPDPATGKAPKTELRNYQPGARVGGPIFIPGVYDGHNRAFFFFNYEETRSPRKVTYDRSILSAAAQSGIFQYNSSAGVRSIPLLDVARTNGLTSTIDPTVAKLLEDVRATTPQGEVRDLSDPNLQRFTFQNPARGYTPSPTIRIDYNLSQKHRLTGSYNYQHINSRPDTTNNTEPRFPGFAVTGSQQSTRWTTSEAVRSSLSQNLVNEFRFGGTGGPTLFQPEYGAAMYHGIDGLANTAGFHFGMNSTQLPITNVAPGSGNSSREAYTRVIENTLSWIKGNHSLAIGASFTQAEYWFKQQTYAPTIDFGIPSGDPADAVFATSNAAFRDLSTTQLTAARELYSILTGRINSITANARLNEDSGTYDFLGLGTERGRMREFGFFVQDAWRVRANLTINAGLRYELQRPFYALNNSYYQASVEDVWGVSGVGNLFQQGVLTGRRPVFVPYTEGTQAYQIDKNNFAPSLGLAWVPDKRSGFLGRVIGDSGDTVLRAAYAFAYNRPGMSSFRGIYSANPGVTISTDRTTGLNNLVLDGAGLPLLLRDRNRLGAPPFPTEQVTPFTEVITGDVNVFDPKLQVPYSQTWTAGLQRRLTQDTVVEVRYVGTRHLQPWQSVNYNEANIVENNFLNEFRNAQANLQANNAAGGSRAGSFAYFGPGTGTVPLPIYLGYFRGTPLGQAGDQSQYVGVSQFANSNFTTPLARFNPNPFTPAGTNANTGLDGDATRRANAARAGIPVNFFRVNPDLLGGANINGNGGYTRYNSLQIDLRKRLSHGLQVQGSYVYGVGYASNRYSFRTPYRESLDTGDEGGVTHAFKGNWVYELPFGQGRKFANAGGWKDRLVSGWSIDGVARVQSGQLVDFGNVRIYGMSAEEFKKSFKLQEYAVTGINPNAIKQLYVLPQDIVENTVRAFSTSATSASGYGNLGAPTGRYLGPANGPDCIEPDPNGNFGDCGVNRLEVAGPRYVRVDLSAVKRIRLASGMTFEFRGEMLNAFNHPNFVPVTFLDSNDNRAPSNADNYRVTDVQENSSRIVQLVFRLNW
jgi:Carboxypeptidase regulatory-like domain